MQSYEFMKKTLTILTALILVISLQNSIIFSLGLSAFSISILFVENFFPGSEYEAEETKAGCLPLVLLTAP